jgi:cupin-like protein
MSTEVIHRIDASDHALFLGRYYQREEPVIISGIASSLETDAVAVWQALLARAQDDRASQKRFLWFDVRPDVIAPLCPTPAILQPLLDDPAVYLRPNFIRVWFSRRGHITPWHYDGNSLHVCNLQLVGRKRWRIVSPHTPLACLPFSNTCLFRDYSLEEKHTYEFEVDQGELLFLPRYWFHNVESLDDVNVNVNWVLTSTEKPAPSKTARREAELLWLMRRVSRVMATVRRKRHGRPDQESDVLSVYASDVTVPAALLRAAREMLRVVVLLPMLPLRLGEVTALARARAQLALRVRP